MKSVTCLLLSVIFLVTASQKVKIGVLSGPGTDRRENSERFWSFNQNFNPSLQLEPVVKEVPWWTALEVARAVCSVSKAGVLALSVQSPPRLVSLIASYADSLQLPLATALTRGGILGTSQINLLPDTTHAAAALLQYWGWESFGYVYDTDTGPEQLQTLFDSMDPHPQIEPFWRTYTAEDAYAFIQKLPRNFTKILLATSEKLADELFAKLASSPRRMHGVLLKPVGLLQPITTPGPSQLTKFSFVERSQQLTELENRWKTLELSQRQNGKELPDSALVSSDISKVFYNLFSQTGDERSSLVTPDLSTMSCFNYSTGINFKKTTISGEGVTGSLQFNEDGYRIGYTLNIVEASPYNLKKVGSWSDGSGLQMSEIAMRDAASIRSRPTFAAYQKNESPIRVTSILTRPFLMKNEEGGFEGYIADLVDALKNVTGRNFVIQLSTDGRYGYREDNGEWNGMIGDLLKNNSDVVLADLTKTKMRAEVIDFGRTFMTFGLTILMKKPVGQDKARTSFEPFSFLTVWDVNMWMILLLIIILFAIISYFISRFIGAPDRIRALESKRTDNLSPCGSFWYTIGSLLLRDTGIYPRSFTYRLWAILWWTFCFFILVSYISALTAALIQTRQTVTSTYSRTSSHELLEDLLTKGSPDIGTLRSGSSKQFFKNSAIGLYKDFGRYLDQNQDVMSNTIAEGAIRVRQSDGSYAFIMESPTSTFQANIEPCDVIASSGFLTTRTFAPAFPKNSTIKEMLDRGILSLMEDGTLRQLYEKWWHLTSACEDPNMDILPEVYSRSMRLHEVSGIFYILCIGVVLALASTLIEHYFSGKRISLE